MNVAYVMGSLTTGGTEHLVLDVLHNSHKKNTICIHRKKGHLYEDYVKCEIELKQINFKHKLDFFYFFRLRKFVKNNI